MGPLTYLHSGSLEIRGVWILAYCIGDCFWTGHVFCKRLNETVHNVKSDLIWRKYSHWWLYKAIAIKLGDLRRAGNFGRCLLGTYWGTPDGWHTLTQTNTNTFQYWALLAVKWWPLLPKYGHKSNKINGIELFSLQSLYIYSQEPKKASNLPKFWPPIFPANRAKFYIVQADFRFHGKSSHDPKWDWTFVYFQVTTTLKHRNCVLSVFSAQLKIIHSFPKIALIKKYGI